jgi:hypothetical protein
MSGRAIGCKQCDYKTVNKGNVHSFVVWAEFGPQKGLNTIKKN